MPRLTRTAARHSSFGCSTHSRAVHKSDSYARLSFSLPNRKRYKVHATTDRWNNANQAEEFPYRRRYKVTCDDNLNWESTYADRQDCSVCDCANEWPADIFISIHCNAANGMAHGTETLIHSEGGRAEQLAECIQRQIVDSLDTTDRGLKERPELIVLRATDMPAVLVELAFIDNDEDAELLMTRQDDFARAIARGVTDYELLL